MNSFRRGNARKCSAPSSASPSRIGAGSGLVAAIAGLVVLSTAADVLMPVFAGRLVDAVALGGGDRDAARDAALARLRA